MWQPLGRARQQRLTLVRVCLRVGQVEIVSRQPLTGPWLAGDESTDNKTNTCVIYMQKRPPPSGCAWGKAAEHGRQRADSYVRRDTSIPSWAWVGDQPKWLGEVAGKVGELQVWESENCWLVEGGGWIWSLDGGAWAANFFFVWAEVEEDGRRKVEVGHAAGDETRERGMMRLGGTGAGGPRPS